MSKHHQFEVTDTQGNKAIATQVLTVADPLTYVAVDLDGVGFAFQWDPTVEGKLYVTAP